MAGQQYVFEDLTVADVGETTAARIVLETLAAMALVLRLAVNASKLFGTPAQQCLQGVSAEHTLRTQPRCRT